MKNVQSISLLVIIHGLLFQSVDEHHRGHTHFILFQSDHGSFFRALYLHENAAVLQRSESITSNCQQYRIDRGGLTMRSSFISTECESLNAKGCVTRLWGTRHFINMFLPTTIGQNGTASPGGTETHSADSFTSLHVKSSCTREIEEYV